MKNNKYYKIGFYATVCIVGLFTNLKIIGVIAWSWWWITAPVWIPFLLAVILVVIYFVLLRKYNDV